MTSKAAEKIIDALAQLMEGFAELQQSIEDEFDPDRVEDDDDDEVEDELDGEKKTAETALITELKAAIEGVIDSEDYSPEEFASLISAMSQALEELDPDIFVDDDDATEPAFKGSAAGYDIDDDDDLYDYDDDDDDDDDDDEDEDEDEDEEEEEDEEEDE